MLWVAGVDEAGRGPLAGPVTAAAVILDPSRPIHGLDDSKRLSPARRAQLEVEICARSRAWAVAWADVAEIETLNILHASLLAMRRAVAALSVASLDLPLSASSTTATAAGFKTDGAISSSNNYSQQRGLQKWVDDSGSSSAAASVDSNLALVIVFLIIHHHSVFWKRLIHR